jgi:sigma-E factor negative regulatory protein RseA
MSIGSESDLSALEKLSALADGEVDAGAVSRACSAWRDDAAARSTWHAYQLIGDVLRSDDLASDPAHDAAFLAAVRGRLAAEPVVLAPEPISEPAAPAAEPAVRHVARSGRGVRWSWMAPSAVAAGFVMVAGALFVTRSPLPGQPGGTAPETTLARSFGGAAAPGVGVPMLAASETRLEAQTSGVNGKLIRDPRLDRYLDAHKQFAGSSALGVPSGFLRNAAVEAPNR